MGACRGHLKHALFQIWANLDHIWQSYEPKQNARELSNDASDFLKTLIGLKGGENIGIWQTV